MCRRQKCRREERERGSGREKGNELVGNKNKQNICEYSPCAFIFIYINMKYILKNIEIYYIYIYLYLVYKKYKYINININIHIYIYIYI